MSLGQLNLRKLDLGANRLSGKLGAHLLYFRYLLIVVKL